MPGDVSIRQRIVTNIVDTIKGAGLVRGVEDAEPWDYTKVPLPYAWVIEGVETVDAGLLESRAECVLRVLVQIAFPFSSSDAQRTLYRTGRRLLAEMQELMMRDLRRGGFAFLTLEAGNSIGSLEASEKPVGVLTTEWDVKYHRRNNDPYSN